MIVHYLPASEAAFLADPPLQSHILRHLQIIGEASNRLAAELRQRHPEIPWLEMIGMRNITIHDYAGINWHSVFQAARHDVPILKPQIQAILDSVILCPAGRIVKLWRSNGCSSVVLT